MEFLTEENSLLTTSNSNELENREAYKDLAYKILNQQKTMGQYKVFHVKMETIPESRKRRLKDAGKLIMATLPLSAIAGALCYATGGKNKEDRKISGIAGVGATGLVGAGVAAKETIARHKHKCVIVIAEYKYGKKIFNIFDLTPKVEEYNVIPYIGKNLDRDIQRIYRQEAFAVREDVSLSEYKELTANDYLVEEVLDSEYDQLLEDEEITSAAKEVSDFQDVEVEEVEEGFLFEDEDEEAEATDDEEELDEEVFFETDMFKIQ